MMSVHSVEIRKETYYCYLCEKPVPRWQEHLLPVGKSVNDVIQVCPTCYANYFGFTSGD